MFLRARKNNIRGKESAEKQCFPLETVDAKP